jgi:Flp pilus assembly protein TadD
MSLIINMLKDLDQRHHHTTQAPALVTTHQHAEPRSPDLYKKIFIIIAVIIFMSVLLFMIMHRKTALHSMQIPAEKPVVKSALNESASDNISLTPVSISGISFEAKTDATEVTFLLSHDTLYRLVSDEKNHSLNLYIDNATMQSDLPTLIGAEVAIQHIAAFNSNGSMKFSIRLKKEATLKSVILNKEGKQPELIISIANTHVPPADPVKISSGIKSPAIQTVIIEQYQNAIKLAETGNRQEAMASLVKLLGYYPDYDDARVALAAMTLENGNSSQARKIIDDGLVMSPDYIPLIELKARVLTSEGKNKEALMVLQSEQPPIAEAPAYHALMAALYSRENNFNLSAAIYKKLVNINPHDGSSWFGLGVSLDKLGQNQDAVYAYTKAATEGRLNPQAMSFLQSRLQLLQDSTHA